MANDIFTTQVKNLWLKLYKTILFKYFSKNLIILKKLEQQLDLEKNRHREVEKMNKLANIENEHYIVNLKMEYEERMKGLLPIEVRKVITLFTLSFSYSVKIIFYL